MVKTTFKHELILGDTIRIKKDKAKTEYLIESVTASSAMIRVDRQIMIKEGVFYTIMNSNFESLGSSFYGHELEKIAL